MHDLFNLINCARNHDTLFRIHLTDVIHRAIQILRGVRGSKPVILGVAGPPGSGKTLLSRKVLTAAGSSSARIGLVKRVAVAILLKNKNKEPVQLFFFFSWVT